MPIDFHDLEGMLKDLDPKIKNKAIQTAIELIKEKGMDREDALEEGIILANEWFLDLEG